MNPGIRILPLSSASSLPGGRMGGMSSGQFLVLSIGNTTTLLLSLKRLEILHQERRGQVETMVLKRFNGILFHKSGPAKKQHLN